MLNQFKLLSLSASILSAMLLTSPLKAESLTEAVDNTLKTNPNILAESNRRLSVDKTIDQARAGYLPQVDLDLGIGRQQSENVTTRPGHATRTRGEAGITARQMVYDGFATKSAVEQSQSLAESAGYGVTDASESVGLRAVEVYLDVLRRQELLAQTEDNLNSHDRIFSQIRQRSEAGVGSRADLDQTSGRLALSKANLRSTQGNLADAESNYQRVVGHLPTGLTDPGKECCNNAPASVDDAIKMAYNQHPALRSAIAQHEAALAQQEGAKAPFHPRVDLELNARSDNNLNARDNDDAIGGEGYDKSLQAMVRMNYNLLNGGADQARLEATGHLSEQAKEEANIAQRNIERDVRLAWSTIDKLSSQLPVMKQRVESAEKTRDAYQQQFNLGQRTLLDLLDTENEVLSARSNYTNAYYDQIYACYWLAESMGQLLNELQLKAPETAIAVASPETRN